MVLPCYFLDNVREHVRDLIHREGGDLLAAFRLPDHLFQNARVTVDIVFLKKGKTGNPWLSVQDVKVGGLKKPMNEYFHHNSHHILGNLEVIPMYERTGLTCKPRGNLKPQLERILQSLKQEKLMELMQPLKSLTSVMELLSF